MDSIHIDGGVSLKGQVKIQGSKNAVLPILSATLLIEGVSLIHNCPKISDVYKMLTLMKCLGSRILWEGNSLRIDNRNIKYSILPKKEVTGMRSSILLAGSMLARVGSVDIEYPGGCVIGKRPVDFHLQAFRKMGVQIAEKEQGFHAFCDRLKGTIQELSFPSVGVTENILLGAVLADGITIVENAAKEPEVVALCEFLKAAGAKINGIGSGVLMIEGVSKLRECQYEAPSDRIVAGTYLLAGMITGGDIFLEKAPANHLQALLDLLKRMGGQYHIMPDGIYLQASGNILPLPKVETAVYPGFPTDLQSPLMAVLSVAEGTSILTETVFENRFRIAQPLESMGAKIVIRNNSAYIEGVERLTGGTVYAEELRGGAALVIAGLKARGTTIIKNCQYIERGYVNIGNDLRELGARVYCV